MADDYIQKILIQGDANPAIRAFQDLGRVSEDLRARMQSVAEARTLPSTSWWQSAAGWQALSTP